MHASQGRQFDNTGPPVDEFADIPHVAEDEDDDDELTDAEKDKQAQRCLWVRVVAHVSPGVGGLVTVSDPACVRNQMANICLMLSGGACAGIGMYTGFSGHGGAWPGYVVAGVGAFLFVVCFLGFVGALRINRQMLRLVRSRRCGVKMLTFHCGVRVNRVLCLPQYYTCMILGSMANFVLAGFCFLFIKQAKNYLATNWDAIVAAVSDVGGHAPLTTLCSVARPNVTVAPVVSASALSFSMDYLSQESPATRPSLSLAHEQSVIQRNLIICGAFAVVTLLLALSVTGSVMRLVSKVSGYSILLQSTSITLLPFGAVLIAAGLFIGDSTGAGPRVVCVLFRVV
jgi:hypothetical protein